MLRRPDGGEVIACMQRNMSIRTERAAGAVSDLLQPTVRSPIFCVRVAHHPLRRTDTCVACGSVVAAGTRASWNAADTAVTCLACANGGDADDETTEAPKPLDRGTAGSSTRRRYEALHERREQQAVNSNRSER